MTRRVGAGALAVIVLLCGVTLALGFANKDRCAGPEYADSGRSEPNYQHRSYADACYSDIQYLWLGRDIDKHVFPYVHGGLDRAGELTGGAVEYPVLTGVLAWAGALFADTDGGFLLGSAILLAPFGLLTAWLLGKLAGWRALLWALGPPLVLYAFHNWDLAAVACSVAAFFVVLRGRAALATRTSVAAVLLGIGFALKLYPAIFAIPLALYVLTGGRDGREGPQGPWLDWRGALRVLGVGAGTAVAVNLPFALAGFPGWWASFRFQADRDVDVSANSVWFWAFRPDSDPSNAAFQSAVDVLSPLLIGVALVLACVLGWRRYGSDGEYPLLAVSAAMVCGFLLFYKVHSPQYALWLLPMFVLLRIKAGWIVAYLLADLALGIGVFRWFADLYGGGGGGIYQGFAGQAVVIGVWGRAALLVGLFFAFLTAESASGSRKTAEPHVA